VRGSCRRAEEKSEAKIKSGESRREFLLEASGCALSFPFISSLSRPALAAAQFDPSFGTAFQAVRAIREGAISARELLGHTLRRIKKYNPEIEAFITLNEDDARLRAKLADEELVRRKPLGRLHGLPIVVKDTFATAGLRTTSGSKHFEQHVPTEDSIAVARLKSAGAIIVGKTNMPEFASDMQSYNEVAETTNNPWDLSRTPGGSTGGGAAALAAGFGFLELGSDIGGSIRIPSHFCGVYGHKPTLNLVPLKGHIPPAPGEWSPEQDLGVAGPMARSAQDLSLELEVIAGPASEQVQAYGWSLPSPRGTSLQDYRIGYVLDDPFCAVSPEVREPLEASVHALRRAGANLVEGWPAEYDPVKAFEIYLRLLAAAFSDAITAEERELMRDSLGSFWGDYARGWLEGSDMAHAQWLVYSGQRLKLRAIWQKYFKSYDAFLMPVNMVSAFVHSHELSFFQRTISTSAGERQYGDMLRWISPATLTGCPATVAPVGRTHEGLPVGIQIMGPFLEDGTTIELARHFGDVTGGFSPPNGFE